MNEATLKEVVSKQQNIIIYGSGMVGELVYKRLASFHMQDKVSAFAVTKKVSESCLFDLPICEIGECVSSIEDTLVVVATFPVLHSEMRANLESLGVENYLLVDELLYEEMSEHYIADYKNTHFISFEEIDVLLMASDNSCVSGAFLCLVDLAKELNESGIRTLVILPLYGNGEKLLQEKGVEYWFVESEDWTIEKEESDLEKKRRKLEKNKAAVYELEELIKQYKVRVVHNNTTYTYVGAVAAHNSGVPMVWHLREFLSAQGRDFIDADKAKKLINKSTKILFTSEYLGTCIDYVDKELISVVYDGVDTTRYIVNDKRLFSKEVLNVLIIGNIIPLKNQIELLEAAVVLLEKGLSKFHISIIGSGEKKYMSMLADFIQRHKLDEYVSFLGRQSDMSKYYKEADLVVVCSKAEAFGRTTVEAQLAGCIVIGARAGATSELIRDKETGLLYELGDSKELADKVLWCVAHQKEAERIAINGQEFASDLYTKKRNAHEVAKIYQQIWNK